MRERRPGLLPTPPRALVVCNDSELLKQLRDYLVRAGVPARATRCLDDAWRRSSDEAVVLFPDDFDAGEVMDGLSRLRAPFLPIILVTAHVRQFEPLVEQLASPDSFTVLPQPVWGWTILDRLRGSADASL